MEVRGTSGGWKSSGPKSEGGAPNVQRVRCGTKSELDEWKQRLSFWGSKSKVILRLRSRSAQESYLYTSK